MSPNCVASLTYHAYYIIGAFLQTNPVKGLRQCVKIPLESYRLHIFKGAVVIIEVFCQTLHVPKSPSGKSSSSDITSIQCQSITYVTTLKFVG